MTTRPRTIRSSRRKRAGRKTGSLGNLDVEVLLDLARPWRTRKLPPPGTSVVYDRHYSDLEHEGFLHWVQTHPHHTSLTDDHYELTPRGHARVASYRQWMTNLGTPKHKRHANFGPETFRRGGTNKSNAPRGFAKSGECPQSRTKWRFTRSEIASGAHKCSSCGAPLTLRRLSPGMQGEPRVSEYIPAHKATAHHGDLGPQFITGPGSRPGLVNVLMVNSRGDVLHVLHRNLPYQLARDIIRRKPIE